MTSYNFKIVLLGQGFVGKTSLVLRYISNVFDESHHSTLQASFLKKQLYLERDLVRLNIWDTAGQEKFHALGPIYYREAHGALIVYDVTNPDSLKKVRDWVKELNKMLGIQNVCLAIVGNKVDLLPGRVDQVAAASQLIQEAGQLSDELANARHYLTSAKLNQGLAELFVNLSKRMIEQQLQRRQHQQTGKLARTTLHQRTISVDCCEHCDCFNHANDQHGDGPRVLADENHYCGNSVDRYKASHWHRTSATAGAASGQNKKNSCLC